MKHSYLVVLGDKGNRHNVHMLERLRKAGQSSQLVDNVFVLTVENRKDLENMELVRNYIAGDDFGYCLVITINSSLSCAWNLSLEKTKLLDEIVKEQQDEEK